MFKNYGFIGIILILFVELNFFLKIEPLARWYFPLVWFGYIFVVDALIYKVKSHSLLMNRRKQIYLMLLISALVWWIFEYINYRLGNWSYINLEGFRSLLEKSLFGWISFSTVIPAIFETEDLLRTAHLFDWIKLKMEHKISKRLVYGMILSGTVSFLVIMAFPKHLFPLIWASFYLILDPINYLHHQPSIIKHLKDKKLALPISLLLAGLLCGFFWEFWNYWALSKWIYILPSWTGPKLFEMPLLGYLGYPPFAWEVYAMYYFLRSLVMKEKKEVV